MNDPDAGPVAPPIIPAQQDDAGYEDVEQAGDDAGHRPKKSWRRRFGKESRLKRMIRIESQADKVEKRIRKVFSFSVDDFPPGYPLLSAFQSSKPAFSIYRSFDYLHSRVILELQDQLRELEDRLRDLDLAHYASPSGRQNWRVSSRIRDLAAAMFESDSGYNLQPDESSDREQDGSPGRFYPRSERADILDQIQIRLVKYDEILAKARELVEFQRPSKDEWLSFRRWYNNKKPLRAEDEDRFIRMRDDLITLRPRNDAGKIDDWIERVVGKMPEGKVTTYFYDHGMLNDKHLLYFKVARVEALAVLIVAFVIILLLAVPMFIMYRVTEMRTRSSTYLNIFLLIVFALLFSAAMGLLTKAKRAELFAGTAAYCAVLVVFIGNFSIDVSSSS